MTCSYRTGFFQVARCPHPAVGQCPTCKSDYCAAHLACARCAKAGRAGTAAAAGAVAIGVYDGTLVDDFTEEDFEAMRRATSAEELAHRKERFES